MWLLLCTVIQVYSRGRGRTKGGRKENVEVQLGEGEILGKFKVADKVHTTEVAVIVIVSPCDSSCTRTIGREL